MKATKRHIMGKHGRSAFLSRTVQALALAAAVLCTTAPARGAKVSGTPDKYIDYVQSTGQQYINTGINGRSGTKVAVAFTGYGGDSFNGLFGENTGHQFLIDHRNANGIRFLYDGFEYKPTLTTGDNVYNDISVEISSDGATLTYVANGARATAATGRTSQDSGTPMYIFGYNLNGSHVQGASVKMYAFRIWQDGVLVRNFRPCMKNNEAGLYDTVEGYIYTSETTTPLNAPPDTEPIYLKFLQSSGGGYFNTGLPMRSGTKLTFDIADVGQSFGALFGLFKDDAPKSYTMLQSPNAANYLRGFCNGTGAGSNFNLLGNGAHNSLECEINTSGAMYVTLNGTSLGSPYLAGSGAFSFPQMMYLLSASWQDGNNYNILPVTLYGCTISQTAAYDSGSDYTPVRDFVPASKYELTGLVDTVDGVFYPCVGTLTAGPTKGIALVDSVKSDGALYVDTGLTPKSGTSLVIDYADWTGPGGDTWYRAIVGAINGAHQLIVRATDGLTAFGSSNNASGNIASFPFTGRHTLAADWTKGGTTYISADGGAIQTPLSDKGEYSLSDRTIWLFAANNGSAYRPSIATLYGARIWQDGVLVRDFRPCVTAAGKAALYDMVSASVFYAQGGDLELPADTTERPATAVWKGGAVSSAADLANAANWTCTSLSGEMIANAVPGGATTVNISSVSDPLLSIPSGVTVPAWAGVRISGNLALAANADWTKLGTVTLGTGTAINLAGYGLTLSAFAVESGSAAFNNSGASIATLTLTGTAGTSFNGVSIGDKVKVVKSGMGDAARSTELGIGGATGSELEVTDGTLYGNAGLVAGGSNTGTIKVSGGKVNASYLIVTFTTGGVGVFEQSGGEVSISGDITAGYWNGVGTVRQSGGKMTVGGTVYLGKNNPQLNTTGEIIQSAGEINIVGTTCIGYKALGNVVVGGTMTIGAVEFGNYGGTGTLCVTNGGRLVTRSFVKGSGTANILFDGGTVQATAENANFFNTGVGTVNVALGAGGLTLETEYDLGFNATTITTSGGAIRKVGAGALDLSRLTVEVGDGVSTSFDFATAVAAEGGETVGTFTGLPTVALPWKARLTNGGTRCNIYKGGFTLFLR